VHALGRWPWLRASLATVELVVFNQLLPTARPRALLEGEDHLPAAHQHLSHLSMQRLEHADLAAHLGAATISAADASAHGGACRYCSSFSISRPRPRLGFRYSVTPAVRQAGGAPKAHHSHRHRPGRPAGGEAGIVLLFLSEERTFSSSSTSPSAGPPPCFGVSRCSCRFEARCSRLTEAGRHRSSAFAQFT